MNFLGRQAWLIFLTVWLRENVSLAQKPKDSAKKYGIVLAIPRGGVVVGYEIAKALDLPLDVMYYST